MVGPYSSIGKKNWMDRSETSIAGGAHKIVGLVDPYRMVGLTLDPYR
jgi:hypothetical protein